MPAIILMLIGLYYLVRWLYEEFIDVPPRSYTMDEIKDMNNMFIGKSQKECKFILKHYDEIKRNQKNDN